MDIVTSLRSVRRVVSGFSLALMIASFFAISVAQAQTFPDVPTDAWSYTFVEDLVAQGIIDGTKPAYRPGDNTNRAEFAKLVVEAFDLTLEDPATPTFKDVPKCDTDACWFYKYVETAAKHGIVGGYKDTEGNLTGYFGPADPVTREQAAKMITIGAPLTVNTTCGASFSDVTVTNWSYEYVETLYAWSVVDGYSNGTFGPADNIKRDQVAKVVSNALAPKLRPCGGFSVASATALSDTTAEVCYTQEYDATSALMAENYAVEDADGNALAVSAVEASSDPLCVVLTTAAQDSAASYSLTVSDVTSKDAQALVGATATFNGFSVADAGDMTVSLDGSTPSAAIIPLNGANIPFAVFNFAAGANENVRIEQLTVSRTGLGTAADFTNIKLYVDGVQKGSEKTVNSSTNAATFTLVNDPIVVEAGKSVLVEARADMSAASSGAVNALCVNAAADVLAYGETTDVELPVSGDFAICGENMTTTSANVGTLTYTVSQPSTANINIGDKDVVMAKVKMDAANEAMVVDRLTFKQGGSANPEYFANLRLVSSGTALKAEATWDGDYVTFDLVDDNMLIDKGNSKTVELWADVVGGLNTTAQFDIYRDWHIEATGQTYHYGVNIAEGGTSVTPANRNIVGGNIAFALASSNPILGDVAKGARDHEFLRFNISTSGDAVTVRKLTLYVTPTAGGAAEDAAHIEDLKIWGKNSAGDWTVVSGPDDVAALSTNMSFTDSFDIPAATTAEFMVTADITNTALTGEGYRVDLITPNNATTTELEYGDGTAVNEATEVTGGTLAGNAQTVAVPSVGVSLASVPGNKSYVKNTIDRDIAAFDFLATTASDIKVTAVTVSCANTVAGVCSDAFQSLYLYEKDGSTLTKLDGPRSMSNAGAGDGTVVFSLNHTITAGDSSRLLVRSNIASAAAADAYVFNIGASNVTAEDSESSTATVTGLATGNRTVTVAANGVLTNQGISDTDTKSRILVGNATMAPLMKVRYSADDLEDWYVKKMTIQSVGGGASTADTDLSKLYIKYTDVNGVEQTAQGTLTNGTPDTVTFSNLNGYVKAGQSITLTVYGDVADVTAGGAVAGDSFQLEFDGAVTFEAVGASSGTLDSSATTVTAETMRVAKSAPTVVKNSVGTTLADGEVTLYEMTVTADSAADLAIKQIGFDYNAGLGGGTLGTFKVFKNDVLVSDTANVDVIDAAGVDVEAATSVATGSGQVLVKFDAGASGGEDTVLKGTTVKYTIKATVAGSNAGESVSFGLANDATGAAGVLTGANKIAVGGTASNFVWSDLSLASHSAVVAGPSTADWLNGWLVNGLSSAGSNILTR